MQRRKPASALSGIPIVGWREWLSLPDLGIHRIKAKIDTGARTSALHAFDIVLFEAGRKKMVRFGVHPLQDDSKLTVKAEAEVIDQRLVRSSSGRQTLRPVVLTDVELLGKRWPIELTLVGRDEMGFRMLLGRQAIRRRWLVDPGASFVGGKPGKRQTKKKKAKRARLREGNTR